MSAAPCAPERRAGPAWSGQQRVHVVSVPVGGVDFVCLVVCMFVGRGSCLALVYV